MRYANVVNPKHPCDQQVAVDATANKGRLFCVELSGNERGLRQEPVVPLRIGIHQGDISYDTQGAYGDWEMSEAPPV